MQPILITKMFYAFHYTHKLPYIFESIQNIKYSIQLSCNILLNFISWKNSVCNVHFGIAHCAFAHLLMV
jgi:hypothetical protein